MCLLFCCRSSFLGYPFVLLANRDEYYHRPTAAAEFWTESPEILAGRDLEHNGTWLGVTREGRWAALTNFREVAGNSDHSRGELVAEYLKWNKSLDDFIKHLTNVSQRYSGFNLMFGDTQSARWFSNRGGSLKTLGSGIFGLSNHLLDTPWPKVEQGKRKLHQSTQQLVIDELFSILNDQGTYPDDMLPDTGVSSAFERLLSSAFIRGDEYGTRSSTLITIDDDNQLYFEERTYDNPINGQYEPREYISVSHSFQLSL